MSSSMDERDEFNLAEHLAKALMPYASTSGFVQYGVGGRSCPTDDDLLLKQAEMLAAIISVLYSKNRRFTLAVAKKAVEVVYSFQGF